MNLDILKDKKVLYVEDDESIMDSFLPILEKLFHTVYTASDGLAGLEKFKENKDDIDYVISDIKMPEMDGLDMSKHIKEINPDIPCLITTAHGEYDYFLKADEIGVYRYIQKPLDINEIFEAIENFEDGLKVKKTEI